MRALLLTLLIAGCAHTNPTAHPQTANVAVTPPATIDDYPITRRQDLGGSIAAWTPVRGPRDAKVTIVEYSDFQCPFCVRSQATLKEVLSLYGDRVRLAFRHVPLPFHAMAEPAAEAAMAASAQGKFWEMHDALFERSSGLSIETIHDAARAIGLDMAKFDRALTEHRFTPVVESDLKHAGESGVRGTPAFFINGHPLMGAQPIEAFRAAVEEELRQAYALLNAGAPANKLYDIRLATLSAEEKKEPEEEKPLVAQKAELAKWTPIHGPKFAKVTIVEYSDFQCPFCSRVNPTLKALAKEYGKDLRIAFRNNPLPFHEHAREAAEAAMAASEQGKFWEMHDLLFANQSALEREHLDEYARKIGLDMPRFRRSMKQHAHKDEIDSDVAEAEKVGATGTPNFFVNGRPLRGAQPEEVFRKVIDEEKTRAEALLEKGAKLEELYQVLLNSQPTD